MGDKMLKRKKTTAADLPEELVRREILTRLPIKSAVRFKCVSKSWLSLFSNPQFVKDHLTRNTTRNPNDYDCLVANKHNKIVILSRYKESFALFCERIRLVGSVRGLVCLRYGCLNFKLSLWNPAIHQSKEFTLPPSLGGFYIKLLGFGFDPVSDNYKVVVMSATFRSASVYYSNSDSWIDVPVPNLLLKKDTYLTDSKTIVKDCPYWKFTTHARGTDEWYMLSNATSLTLLKFDTGSNDFKLLPEFHIDTSVHGESEAFGSEFVDINDCLYLIVYDRNSSKCMLDIYSLDGEEECGVWSKMYTIGPLKFSRQHWIVSQGFCSGEIVFHDSGMFSSYDQKTDTIKRLSTTSMTASFASATSVVSCYRYTPSLVFLEGMKSVYLPTQTRRATGLCSRVPRRLISSLKIENKDIRQFSLSMNMGKLIARDGAGNSVNGVLDESTYRLERS